MRVSDSFQAARNIKNTVTDLKRLLGRKFSEPEAQEEIKNLPFTVVQLPGDEIGVKAGPL